MDIDKELEKIQEKVGHKNISTVKRTFNEIKAEKDETSLKELISEDDYIQLVLNEVAEKFEVEPIEVETEDLDLNLDDLDDDLDLQEEDKGGWEEVFNKTPKPKTFKSTEAGKTEVSTPFLTVIDRVTYKLKVDDPNAEPRYIEGTNKYQNPYEAYLIDVILVDISDQTLYEDVYESGDLKGQPLYEKGKIYTLWLDKNKGFPEFVDMWRSLGMSKPDGRSFLLKRFKRKSKKGRNYNVFKFSIK